MKKPNSVLFQKYSEIVWVGELLIPISFALTYKLTNIMPLSFKVNHSLIRVQRRNFFPGEDHMPICLSSMPSCSITLTGMAQKVGRWYKFRDFFFFFVTSSEYEWLFQHQTGSPPLKPFRTEMQTSILDFLPPSAGKGSSDCSNPQDRYKYHKSVLAQHFLSVDPILM